jgi:invasion protein IalB
MNTSTDTNQTHDTLIGFLRHCLAGAVLATGFVAAPAAIAPALIAPWIPTIDRYTGPWHVNCDSSGGHGAVQCSYG